MAEKKFYWLKLKRDFFKRHDVMVLEGMPNGKDYVLFYLKLLVESIDHEGMLRFSDTIPYNEQMLSTITNTNVDIVRSAMNIFTELQLVEVLDDATIYMTEVNKMIGSTEQDEHTRESTRDRVRAYRERQKLLDASQERHDDVTVTLHERYSNVTCNVEIEKEKEIEKEIDINKRTRFVKPTVEEISAYCKERNNSIDPNKFYDFYESKGWKVGNQGMKDWKACVRTWEQKEKPKTKFNNFENRTDNIDEMDIKNNPFFAKIGIT